jgi:FdhD protein
VTVPLDPGLPLRHVTSTKVVTIRGRELELRDDLVVGEEPLEIRAAGPRQDPVNIAVTMRTPGHEKELAVGFLTTEGLLDGNEIVGVDVGDPGFMAEPDDAVLVRLARRMDPAVSEKRHFIATASCGICGKASIDEVAVRCEPLPRGLPIVARSVILALPDRLREAQAAFERTGGLHAAGLFGTTPSTSSSARGCWSASCRSGIGSSSCRAG